MAERQAKQCFFRLYFIHILLITLGKTVDYTLITFFIIQFLPYLSHFLLWKSYPNLIFIDSRTILM